MTGIEKMGVFYEVHDMERAVRFYREVLGLTLRFRDGDNWAAFDINGLSFALEGGHGSVREGGGKVSFKTSDLDSFVAKLRAARVDVEGPTIGAHERRALVRDPEGNVFYLYEALAK